MANKITYGIQNCYYAPVTETLNAQTGEWTVTYGTPVAMKGARSISLTAQNETVDFSADNNPNYFTQSFFNGYEGNLTMAIIGDDFRGACLNDYVDSNDGIGQITTAKPHPFALLFQFEGDQEEVRHVLYRCIAGQPDIASNTRETTIEPNEEVIPLTCGGALNNNLVKWKVLPTNQPYGTWFNSVFVPSTDQQ